ncbi:phospholipase A1 VesT1.02-like [Venturia canescens]|uniref:phospholipase A1 VesT1.02-like n=1 Tax=Venturia canescens TaxID=32260 RepID=UPI001C9CEC71|nr:phospholipase A1 VesT1.02-like [Venturia canescens]
MLELLIEKAQLKLSKVILVGFSIGAQIMGITGHKLSVKVDTVIGLDPALYPFSTVDATERLSPSSGDYVQVLHTNSDYYGYRKPLGHADFYLNGGTEQPGCNGDPICSHNRAWEYFAESINNNFLGGNCTSYETLEHDIDTLNCNTYFQRFGGLKPDHSIVGIFNAETNDTAPYFPHWIY